MSFSSVDPQRLGTGDPTPDKVLYGDGTWRVPEAGAGITTITVTERAAGSDTTVSSGASGSTTVSCTGTEISIGGGGEATGTLGNMLMSGSRRSGTTGWTTTFRNESGGSRTFRAYVICLDAT